MFFARTLKHCAEGCCAESIQVAQHGFGTRSRLGAAVALYRMRDGLSCLAETPKRTRARARGLYEGFPVTRVTWNRRVLRFQNEASG